VPSRRSRARRPRAAPGGLGRLRRFLCGGARRDQRRPRRLETAARGLDSRLRRARVGKAGAIGLGCGQLRPRVGNRRAAALQGLLSA
jgi:hypothetical protein